VRRFSRAREVENAAVQVRTPGDTADYMKMSSCRYAMQRRMQMQESGQISLSSKLSELLAAIWAHAREPDKKLVREACSRSHVTESRLCNVRQRCSAASQSETQQCFITHLSARLLLLLHKRISREAGGSRSDRSRILRRLKAGDRCSTQSAIFKLLS
jgi:hypothetical protein